jgi:hypothetical protein
LKDKFDAATFDIGYQVFENAFPFQRKNDNKYKFTGFDGRDTLDLDDFEIEFKVKPCKELKLTRDSSALEFREVDEFIIPYV